jgi:hypothetical protein
VKPLVRGNSQTFEITTASNLVNHQIVKVDNDAKDDMDLILLGANKRKIELGSRHIDCRFIIPISNTSCMEAHFMDF